ncbi:hypothetical protein QN277_027976 [Acacia crassicarpa]|uniref:Cysteine-rich transmembrane domain-containing protein n=2 Tax=Acacia crassicarpa TaxID=499986 RepID=A0AAE1JZW9_9FABA|nr:hypothetical protein QN277_027976 [Acacia crassicarpa]
MIIVAASNALPTLVYLPAQVTPRNLLPALSHSLVTKDPQESLNFRHYHSNFRLRVDMSYYDQHQHQPPIGVPPPQGYPPKDSYPPPGYPVQGYPPAGYPQQGYAPQYAQAPPPRQEIGFLEGCLAALCCCCLLDACF